MMRMTRFRSSSSKPRNQNNNLGQCKKHPKHRQSPGVCSLCLTEKLSRVSAASSSGSRSTARAKSYCYCSSSSVSSSDDDSSYASSPGSPVQPHHRRISSDVRLNQSISLNHVMKRRSMAAVFVAKELEEGHNNRLRHLEKKKKLAAPVSGFWSKLLGPSRRNRENSDHLNKLISQSQPLASRSSRLVVC